ncbi:hypothetical protein CDIK_1906 [Cucumispora dikerogammari]|nr:hypothetical protein CDIK_1906 [Cucumispora dikerogammari]
MYQTNETISEEIHNHVTNYNSIKKTKIIKQIKKRATTTTKRFIDIFTNHIEDEEKDTVKIISNFSYLGNTITRTRNIVSEYSINKLGDVLECLKINLQKKSFCNII